MLDSAIHICKIADTSFVIEATYVVHSEVQTSTWIVWNVRKE